MAIIKTYIHMCEVTKKLFFKLLSYGVNTKTNSIFMCYATCITILVMCSVSTNGERASLANLKLTIGSLLECS